MMPPRPILIQRGPNPIQPKAMMRPVTRVARLAEAKRGTEVFAINPVAGPAMGLSRAAPSRKDKNNAMMDPPTQMVAAVT